MYPLACASCELSEVFPPIPHRIPDAAPEKRKELLIAQVNAMTHKQFEAARMKDLNRLRWQTNGIPDPLKEY